MDTPEYELVPCEEYDALGKQIMLLERHIEEHKKAARPPITSSNFRTKNIDKPRSEKSAHRILWR